MTTRETRRAVIHLSIVTSVVMLAHSISLAGTNQESEGATSGSYVDERAMSDIEVDVRQLATELPPDRATNVFQTDLEAPHPRAGWVYREFNWEAPEFWHRPLYFDDVPLERYGQTRHPLIQPAHSGARFFLTFPILPYKMGVDRPCDDIPTLGYYRVGSYAPSVHQRPPLELDASLFEASAWVALIFLLP